MAITSYVLDKPLGNNAAGDVIQVDADIGEALVSAGIASEATEEDLAPDAEPEETLGEEIDDTPADSKADDTEDEKDDEEDEKRRIRNVEDVVTKTVLATLKKSNKGVKKQSLSTVAGNAHVGGSDYLTTGGFKSFGHLLVAMKDAEYGDFDAQRKLNKYKKERFHKSMNDLERKDMSTGSSGSGGLFIPQTWSDNIYKMSFKDVPNLLEMMTKYEMRNKTEHIPVAQQASGTSAVQAYWQTETQAITETDAVSNELQLTLNTLAVLCNLSQQMLDFSSPYNLESFFNSYVPERIRYKLNDSIVNGGNGQANLIGNAATVGIDRATANTITMPDVTAMWIALHESFRSDSVWLVESAAVAQLWSLAFPNGSGTVPAFLPVGNNWTGGQGNLAYPPLGMLYGRPVYQIENLAPLGSTGDLMLVNLKSHAAGFRDLGGASTPYLYFNKLETTFRWVLYAASGNPLLSPYTRKNGSEASNSVVLDVHS